MSAVARFLAAAQSRLVALLADLPCDGTAFPKREEQMHREIAKCLDLVSATVLRAAHYSQDVLDSVELLLEANPYLRLQDSK